MLTLKQIRDERENTISRLAIKGVDAAPVIDQIIELDNQRKALQAELDNNLAEQNSIARSIGQLFKEGKAQEANQLKSKTAELKELSKNIDLKLKEVSELQNSLIVTLPNVPNAIVPEGKSAEDNVEIRRGGDVPDLSNQKLPHWELTKKYDIIDFELGNKLTGAGFPVYKGKGARLERALISMFLDCNTEAGYTEIMPPLMVNEASGFGTGQLPDK
jgi:seryl-tRNA synthetase